MTSSVYAPKYKKFCHLLIEQRQHRGLTQMQLAHSLARPQSFVSKYENGERRLDIIEFLEIAQALDINLFDFINSLQSEEWE